MACASSSCMRNTSRASCSNVSCQSTRPSLALLSSAVTRTLLPSRRKLPSRMVRTPRVSPSCWAESVDFLKRADVARPARRSPGTRDNTVVSSSAIPSARYVLAVSPPTDANGMTASEASLSAVGAVAAALLDGEGDRIRHHAAPPANATSATANIAIGARDGAVVRAVAPVTSPPVDNAESTASMRDGRAAGSFARHCAMSARTAGDAPDAVMAGAGVAICAAVIVAGVVRSANGCAPCNSS